VENIVCIQWTEQDVERAEVFYRTHNVGPGQGSPYPFPKDLFLKFIRENNGYFPVKIEALPEGTVAYTRTPLFQITAEKEYSRLVTFLETILTMLWYPCCVATLSRHTRDLIEEAFVKSVDPEAYFLVQSRLHDFGFRGCTSTEQSVIGGCAHLLNFTGSDTMSACYYAQFELNDGVPVAQSIPATEHSVMTAWRTEQEALENELEHFGQGVCACVMDSYDYSHALESVLPAALENKKSARGDASVLVLRPDSGDPVSAVLEALRAAEAATGATVNAKGYKVLKGLSVIQGDGVNYSKIKAIMDAVLEAGFSAQNVAFGMGGGLLQKVNRDTMSMATKLNFIEYKDGVRRNVMKMPKGDVGKFSLPGILAVERDADGIPRTLPAEVAQGESVMKVVFDHGPVAGAFDNFSVVRERLQREWRSALSDDGIPVEGDTLTPELRNKIEKTMEEVRSSTSSS